MDSGTRAGEHRGEYGFDGSLVGAIGMAAIGTALVVTAVIFARSGRTAAALTMMLSGLPLVLTVAIYVHTTRRGKFLVWAQLIDGLQLRGDERVLDVGCGRGAVLTAVARHLPAGRAVGIDLWTADQSGNSPDATRRNIEAEGASDRCELVTGDMRAMPFADASFDLVVSSLAIHNILSGHGRMQAIDEIARVLKPGGRVAIADLAGTRAYARQLEARGLSGVQRRGLGWRFWWGLAIPATSLVTGAK